MAIQNSPPLEDEGESLGTWWLSKWFLHLCQSWISGHCITRSIFFQVSCNSWSQNDKHIIQYLQSYATFFGLCLCIPIAGVPYSQWRGQHHQIYSQFTQLRFGKLVHILCVSHMVEHWALDCQDNYCKCSMHSQMCFTYKSIIRVICACHNPPV